MLAHTRARAHRAARRRLRDARSFALALAAASSGALLLASELSTQCARVAAVSERRVVVALLAEVDVDRAASNVDL